jgi:hypothetical protein
MQKFIFRSALRPNQISFSHNQGHKQTIDLMSQSRGCPLYPGDLNRSTQHLLILLDKEVADGDVTDIVHGEAEG